MQPEAGARTDAPAFVVLLTDGKSQDDAVAAASQLKAAGVEIIAVGESRRRHWIKDSTTVMFLTCAIPRTPLLWFCSN